MGSKKKVGKSKRKAPKTKVIPSSALAQIVGARPLPLTEVIKKVHAYIKKHSLSEGRSVYPDDTLGEVLGAGPVDMIGQMSSLLREHYEVDRGEEVGVDY